MEPKTELELYRMLLGMYLSAFAEELGKLAPEQWDYAPTPAAPTPRQLAVHAWQWLQCDRQHILQPNASLHERVLEPGSDTANLCGAILAERKAWLSLLAELKPEQLNRPGDQFNIEGSTLNVRGYIGHALQNTIYKFGQFMTLFYALGLDGTEPYTAPLPNPIYAERFGAQHSA